jgi:DNA repair protein RAD5
MLNLILNIYFPCEEFETHSKPGSISLFVHYGGDRSTDPQVIADPDVVLTTYGVLTAAYKKVKA